MSKFIKEDNTLLLSLDNNIVSEKEIKINTVDASQEKHIPVCVFEDNLVKVTVGSIEHPMTLEHHIEWISIDTNKGKYIKYLNVQDKPCACFKLDIDEKVFSVYSYCNLHGLWGSEI